MELRREVGAVFMTYKGKYDMNLGTICWDSFKHAKSGKLNIYSEGTLVYLSLMLLVLWM